MSTSLKAKLFAQASVFPALVSLLGSSPFNWYDTQLPLSANFPAVVVQQISSPNDYAVTGQMPTNWARMQFTVYGSGNDSENANLVVDALESFFSVFNAIGINGLVTYPNLIVGDRDLGVAQTSPMTYQRVVDVRMFYNATI